ncbi:InlB B-repeat-containing protein, partial [Bifidobacterium indicum]|uniref:RCC1 domain-containing protein n=1 Tax=Bifidobacterium indicum TaxID=1691 RepID=UPI0030D9351E
MEGEQRYASFHGYGPHLSGGRAPVRPGPAHGGHGGTRPEPRPQRDGGGGQTLRVTEPTGTTPTAPSPSPSLPPSSSPSPSPLTASPGPAAPIAPASPLPTPSTPLAHADTRATAYTVTFDAAGGTPATPTQQVTQGRTATRPATDPTRDGYQFDGWFTGTTPVAYDFTRPVTQDTTITAHWTKTGQWTISPDHGPKAGGTTVTLTPPPASGIRFSQTSAGGNFSMGIDSKGDLYTWGDNSFGQLGRDTTGTPADRPGRVTAPAGVTFTQASAGDHSSLALGSDGNLYTWGANDWGQLGRDTDTTINETKADRKPGQVALPAGASSSFTWTKATTRWDHTLAFGSDGKLYAWGRNQGGQLGNATIPSGNNNSKAYSARPVLVSVPGGVAFSEVSTGHLHSLALSTNGALYAWGQNSYGMLGMDDVSIGSVVNTPKAVRNTAGVAFTQISAGSSSCLAISSDGSLYAWGDNSDGQLGLGDTAARLTPTQVTKPSAKFWKEASIRDGYSLALSSDGSLYAWGQNTYGQLGIPSGSSNDDILKPTTVGNPSDTPQGFNWMQAHTGWQHSLAIGSDGNLYTWGSSSNGKLGRDTGTAPADRPGRVAFPSRGKPTRVLFDRVQGTGSTPGADGTWTVTTPEHAAGRVPVTISWTLDGTPQADDTSNTYRYEGPAYTVTFKADGGTPATRTQQVTEGDTATRPATDPTRDGYQFDGWFTGTTPVAYDFTRPVTGNTTITAHWTKGDGRWTINPDHGPDTGDTTVTLTPPPARGIRFSQTSAG